MKTSKIKSVKNTGRTFEAHGKTFYVHDYEMEDGTKGQANHTEENKFSVGDDVEYEIKKTHETYGHTLTVKKPDTGFGSGKGASIAEIRREIAKGTSLTLFALGKLKDTQIEAATEKFLKMMEQ